MTLFFFLKLTLAMTLVYHLLAFNTFPYVDQFHQITDTMAVSAIDKKYSKEWYKNTEKHKF